MRRKWGWARGPAKVALASSSHPAYSSSPLCPALCWPGRRGKEDPELPSRYSFQAGRESDGRQAFPIRDERVVCSELY